MNTVTKPTQLVRPDKVEQVAALMLTVFEANPGVRMARCEIESALTLTFGECSDSTRQRALNMLCFKGRIKFESHWPSPRATLYWMPKSGEGQS